MLRYLSSLSGFLFYLLGVGMFGAYVLHRNEMYGEWPLLWMRYGALPMLAAALLYGGISLYRSIRRDEEISLILALTIGFPVLCILVAVAVLLLKTT